MSPKPNLDLLRAIAITLVVVDHTILSKGVERLGRWYVGDIGLFGVYLFFVHTSLVLMWSLERRPNVLDFYIRRAFRIYPLAILTILIAAFTHAPVAGVAYHYFTAAPSWYHHKTILVANCLLLNEVVPNAFYIHGVTWSLGPEVFMYILLPALFFYSSKIRKLWPMLVIWCLVVLYLYSITRGATFTNNFAVLIPDFLAGIIAYVGFMRPRFSLPAWVLGPSLGIFFVIYMALHGRRFDWLLCLALGLLLPMLRQTKSRVLEAGANALATYSYGIYLIHPFSIVLSMYLLHGHSFLLQVLVEFASLILASVLAYHAIEKPLMRFGASVATRLAHEHQLPSSDDLDSLEPAP